MEITREEIQEMIREAFEEVNESDLITKNTQETWQEIKKEFKRKNEILLKHIDDDNYDNADNLIDEVIEVIEMLKNWKKRINKNI
jgi:PHP family Zn ribbon phosphoesterase